MVSILGLLAGLLAPAFLSVVHRARQVACCANLRNWSGAACIYAHSNQGRLVNDGNDYGGLPDLNQRLTADGQPRWKSYWLNILPPALGLTPYHQLAESGQIPMPGNGIESLYLCPDDPTAPGDDDGASGPWATVPYRTANNLPFYFSIMYNNNSTGNGNEPPRLSCVRTPEANVLFSERRTNIGETELPPVQAVLDRTPDATYSESIRRGYTFQRLNVYRGAWSRVSGRHDVGSNAVFMDGSARWVPYGEFQLLDPATGRYTNPRLIWNTTVE
ncbi:MAG: hypothetical protein NTV86_21445 [Planctomycetota bacterium]|nr:hypothetical protein [Planctomycetota bacterium]